MTNVHEPKVWLIYIQTCVLPAERASLHNSIRWEEQAEIRQFFLSGSVSEEINVSCMDERKAKTGSTRLKSLSVKRSECCCHFLYTSLRLESVTGLERTEAYYILICSHTVIYTHFLCLDLQSKVSIGYNETLRQCLMQFEQCMMIVNNWHYLNMNC